MLISNIVDCGATRNFIDVGLLCLLELPLEKLPKSIIANNVDGTTNAKGTIWWKAHTDILFKERTEKLKLMVLSLGQKQIILGIPWLKKWNPTIDWKRNTVMLPGNPLATETTSVPQWYLVCWLGIDANTKINKCLRKCELWKENKSINKITISTQITQQSTPLETPCLTGAPTSQMCSQNKPMPNYHLIAITTTPSTFNQHSPPVSPKSIHLTQLSFRPVKSSLTNTWR